MTSKPDFEGDLVIEGAGFRYFRRRASSFDRRLLQLVFGSLAVFLVLVGFAFAAAGAWLVIPFAGAEITALALAAWWISRRSGDFERVAFGGDRIRVEIRELGLSREFEFDCSWAQLVYRGNSIGLRSHGREIAIGRFCGDEGREALAQALRGCLGRPGWVSQVNQV